MIFLSNPPVYHLPGTWEKQPLIEPGLAIPILIGVVVIGLLGYGIYMTFGTGGKGLKDEIAEHARMHELGIAHGHEGRAPVMTRKAQEEDYPQHKHKD